MKMFTAALMLVLLLAPSGFTLECYVCNDAECNDKFEKKETCKIADIITTTVTSNESTTESSKDSTTESSKDSTTESSKDSTTEASKESTVTTVTTPKTEVTEPPKPENPKPILIKRNQYSFFGRQLKAEENEDDFLRCVKVVYKKGDDTVTKRGCYQVETADAENKKVCDDFSETSSNEECRVCSEDLCNSAKISQMSKVLALVFLLPLLRFFY